MGEGEGGEGGRERGKGRREGKKGGREVKEGGKVREVGRDGDCLSLLIRVLMPI